MILSDVLVHLMLTFTCRVKLQAPSLYCLGHLLVRRIVSLFSRGYFHEIWVQPGELSKTSPRTFDSRGTDTIAEEVRM